jgi:hypothetical protein
MSIENKYVYFLYSEEQLKERNNILAKQGKQFVPGTVYVGMSRIAFTQMSERNKLERFIDTKIVAEGYKNQMKYDLPTNKKREV